MLTQVETNKGTDYAPQVRGKGLGGWGWGWWMTEVGRTERGLEFQRRGRRTVPEDKAWTKSERRNKWPAVSSRYLSTDWWSSQSVGTMEKVEQSWTEGTPFVLVNLVFKNGNISHHCRNDNRFHFAFLYITILVEFFTTYSCIIYNV